MSHSLPEPDRPFSKTAGDGTQPGFPLGIYDILVFAAFFVLLFFALPLALILIARIFEPDMLITDMPPELLVPFQAVMNLILVGFIFILIRVVHGQAFRQCIHWFPNRQYTKGFLIALAVALVVLGLFVSSFFPPSQPLPIEEMMASKRALYIFALFGIGVAPLFEEIIFRGFLFKAFSEIGGAQLAVPATASLFALLHSLQLWGYWAGILTIFVVGYILSLVRARSNSMIPGFIVHTAYNAMLFGVFALSTFVQNAIQAILY